MPDEATARERYRVEQVGDQLRFHDKSSGDVLTHDQVGETFVLAASAAVFGSPLFQSPDPLAKLPPKFPCYETWDAHNARIYG
ncbi:MAG: hypothetical protein QM756_36415 [Polyangiaceae bacterium]